MKKNELSKVMKNKEDNYDEIVEDWLDRNPKGESLIELLEEQWKECDRAPNLFDFIDEPPCHRRMATNRAFLSKKYPGLYMEVVICLI